MWFLGILVLFAVVESTSACTTFCLRDGERIVFGKNYDWQVGDGHLFVNPQGLMREAFEEGARHVVWTSRFGNVTFNQYGRDFPSGGINEAGLVVELMWLDEGEYPAPDERAQIGNLQWIQYHLDTSATVRDVIASDAEIRIVANSPLHYLVADLQGEVAAIEFLEGKMVVHTGEDLPFPALTNSRYDQSREYLRTWRDQHGADLPRSNDSLPRFARTASQVLAYGRGEGKNGLADPVEYSFDLLADAAQGDHTQWSIVYEMHPESGEKKVYWKTHEVPRVKHLRLDELDFSCAEGARTLDLHLKAEGDVRSHLRAATPTSNRRLVRSSYRQTPFLAGLPAAEIDRVVNYPEAARCAGGVE